MFDPRAIRGSQYLTAADTLQRSIIMTVTTIPSQQDPRGRAQRSSKIKFSFDVDRFPAISGTVQVVLSASVVESATSRTWADVVHLGPLVTGTCSRAINMQPADTSLVVDDPASSLEDTAIVATAPSVAELPNPTFHRFLDLPTELRLIAWELATRGQLYTWTAKSSLHYMQDVINICDYVKIKDSPTSPKFLPVIYPTSLTTKNETIAVLIEGSAFMVASIHDNIFLQNFLKAADGRLSKCRQLHFDYFGRFPDGYEKNADLELAAECSLACARSSSRFTPIY